MPIDFPGTAVTAAGSRCVEQCYSVAGCRIAARRWNPGAPRRVLALHGWLDNAASFDRLAEQWPDTDLLAVDLPGHGLSDHKPAQASYNLWDDLLDLLRLCQQLDWQRFHLLGHSRGAMAAVLLAAAVPERVVSAVYLDGLIPEPTPPGQVADQLGRFLREHLGSGNRPRRGYASLADAVAARCRATGMSPVVAEALLGRSLEWRDGRYYWRSDARLTCASAFKLSAEHNQALVEALQPPGLLLLAGGGLGGSALGAGLAGLARRNPAVVVATLPGSHHFHLEPGSAGIAARIRDFWLSPAVGGASEDAVS